MADLHESAQQYKEDEWGKKREVVNLIIEKDIPYENLTREQISAVCEKIPSFAQYFARKRIPIWNLYMILEGSDQSTVLELDRRAVELNKILREAVNEGDFVTILHHCNGALRFFK